MLAIGLFMIFYIIKNITTNPGMVITTVLGFCLALVIGITVHEFSHAFVAFKQGDNTAKQLGRLSLNPIRHLDLFGTAMIFFVGIGWGKPTPVNSVFLKFGSRIGMALVALAGPISNLVVAFSLALFLNITNLSSDSIVAYIILIVIQLNLVLAAFNLIPLIPLDGYSIFKGLLPFHLAVKIQRLEKYGPTPLLVLVALGFISPQLDVIQIFIRFVLKIFSMLI